MVRRLAVAGCALGLAGSSARAQVSQSDFNALREMVLKLNQQVQELQQTHAADAQTHQKDVEELQLWQQKLGQLPAPPAPVPAVGGTAADGPVSSLPRAPIDEATVNHNFMILGDAEFQYAKAEGQRGTFMLADFAPIFLYRGGENILFEAGFDFILQNNAPNAPGYTTTVNLSFAQLNYVANDYVTFAAGNLLLPLGTYSERTAGWLNKLPDNPLARGLLPGAAVGAELRGAVPVNDQGMLLNYAVFGVNGPGSADGTANAGALDLGGNVGLRTDNMVANLHGAPSGGGRVALFHPFKPHYDFELGLSTQAGEWDNAGTHLWSAGVVDAALHLGANCEIKGEYVRSRYGSDDLGMINPEGWWLQAGYKLAGLNLDLPGINNLELVGRYDVLADGMGTRTSRYSAGCIYYLTNTLLFEGAYEFVHSNGPRIPGNQLLLQLSYGF